MEANSLPHKITTTDVLKNIRQIFVTWHFKMNHKNALQEMISFCWFYLKSHAWQANRKTKFRE